MSAREMIDPLKFLYISANPEPQCVMCFTGYRHWCKPRVEGGFYINHLSTNTPVLSLWFSIPGCTTWLHGARREYCMDGVLGCHLKSPCYPLCWVSCVILWGGFLRFPRQCLLIKYAPMSGPICGIFGFCPSASAESCNCFCASLVISCSLSP